MSIARVDGEPLVADAVRVALRALHFGVSFTVRPLPLLRSSAFSCVCRIPSIFFELAWPRVRVVIQAVGALAAVAVGLSTVPASAAPESVRIMKGLVRDEWQPARLEVNELADACVAAHGRVIARRVDAWDEDSGSRWQAIVHCAFRAVG